MLARERPAVVFVQNPSFVLVIVAAFFCAYSETVMVVDAHNGAIFPFEGRKRWANWLAALLFRAADLTIVSNAALAAYVSGRGGTAAVLPDPIPKFSGRSGPKLALAGKYNVLFVCTWARDERYDAVIEAARYLSSDIVIYVSGDSRGKERLLRQPLPVNVILTGYLDDDRYVDMLHSCDVIIDITDRADCLLCGAYEAVAAGTPLIVSDSAALRAYFAKGALYTDNTAADIAGKIVLALSKSAELRAGIRELRQEREQQWVQERAEFERILGSVLRG
jgi:glycosyltransferase involved in cell wall biosynthesis